MSQPIAAIARGQGGCQCPVPVCHSCMSCMPCRASAQLPAASAAPLASEVIENGSYSPMPIGPCWLQTSSVLQTALARTLMVSVCLSAGSRALFSSKNLKAQYSTDNTARYAYSHVSAAQKMSFGGPIEPCSQITHISYITSSSPQLLLSLLLPAVAASVHYNEESTRGLSCAVAAQWEAGWQGRLCSPRSHCFSAHPLRSLWRQCL